MAISAGIDRCLFIKSDGSLWGMGDNFRGELGVMPLQVNLPVQIVASNVTAIAVGESDSLFLKSDGSLWGMGWNVFGELGDGTFNEVNLPEMIVASNVVAIAAAEYDSLFSLFIKSDGSLWAMGENDLGQLGDGTFMTDAPYGTNQPEQIVASNVVAIAAGDFHSLFIKSDGSLWGMGRNQKWGQIITSNSMSFGWIDTGQLGDGTFNNTNRPEQIVASNVVAIAAGEYHSLFIKSDGSMWAMGDNEYGQLGDGTYNNTNRPEQIISSNVIAIAGSGSSIFLKSDGTLWGMGANPVGQLGDGTFNETTNRPEQILGPYNKISSRLLANSDMELSFVGIAAANYALDWATGLSPINWLPVATNPAASYAALVFTNTPDPTTNNFWRIRSVP